MKNRGILLTFSSYLLWGVLPGYFKLIDAASPIEILAHRIIWSFFFVVFLLLVQKRIPAFLRSINWKVFGMYLAAGVLLTINWGVYVYGVTTDRIIETSLGYFINPLVSVVLGLVVLGERLRKFQWIAVALATAGVLYLTITLGKVPWISLILAVSFAVYGLIKKLAPLGAIEGLTMETAVVFTPAAAYFIYLLRKGQSPMQLGDIKLNISLRAAGVVTATPLILFAAGAKQIPLTLVGILQYIAPSTQFLIGIFIFREPFNEHKLVGFILIWIALIIFTLDGIRVYRQRRVPVQPRGA